MCVCVCEGELPSHTNTRGLLAVAGAVDGCTAAAVGPACLRLLRRTHRPWLALNPYPAAAHTHTRSHPIPHAGIERRFRSKLEDFRGSGYDRGHMAPASNHKTSQGTMDESFSLTNMAPQVRTGARRGAWQEGGGAGTGAPLPAGLRCRGLPAVCRGLLLHAVKALLSQRRWVLASTATTGPALSALSRTCRAAAMTCG